MISTSFWSADGKPISEEEFVQSLYGSLPKLFDSQEKLQNVWSNPSTRKQLLEKLADMGYGLAELDNLQKIVGAEASDLYDALASLSFEALPMTREDRANKTRTTAFESLNENQKDFIEFVLSKYIEKGVEELDETNLAILLNLKYNTIADAEKAIGDVDQIRNIFFDLQKTLYSHSN